MFRFLQKTKPVIVAPVDGECIRLETVPDEAFSSGMLGDGFAMVPSGDTVVSPVSGELTLLAPQKHAFAVRTADGEEVLVHIGIDTVKLQGAGFTALKSCPARVKAGTPIIRFDKAVMEQNRLNMVTMVVFTEAQNRKHTLAAYDRSVKAGETIGE